MEIYRDIDIQTCIERDPSLLGAALLERRARREGHDHLLLPGIY